MQTGSKFGSIVSVSYTTVMRKHLVQTKEWADVKTKYGSESIQVGDIFYTKHRIPKTKFYYAYCPRVNPALVDFEKLKVSLKENNCIGLTFDVPNVLKDSSEEKRAVEILEKHCTKSKRSEFAKANVVVDLAKEEKDLFAGMYKKHRYNTRYAAKHGVTVKLAENKADFDQFFKLFKETAIRQDYFIRPKKYYELIWEELHPKGICEILTAEHEGEALASWMIFIFDNVLYYPYGGSSTEHRNLYASNALGWEVIRFGKEKGCEMFDMWGAAEDPEDKSDSYHGFTTFKMKFGGVHVKYIDSYDFKMKPLMYTLFTWANSMRWKLLRLGLIR